VATQLQLNISYIINIRSTGQGNVKLRDSNQHTKAQICQVPKIDLFRLKQCTTIRSFFINFPIAKMMHDTACLATAY